MNIYNIKPKDVLYRMRLGKFIRYEVVDIIEVKPFKSNVYIRYKIRGRSKNKIKSAILENHYFVYQIFFDNKYELFQQMEDDQKYYADWEISEEAKKEIKAFKRKHPQFFI